MADSAQEKTEQATPHKKQEARASGQVAYSKDLTGALLFLAGISGLYMAGDRLIAELENVYTTSLSLPVLLLETQSPGGLLAHLGSFVIAGVMPIMMIALLSTLIPGLAQTQLALSPKKLAMDLSKVSPMKGIKRLFSMDAIANLAGSLLKIALVGSLVWYTLDGAIDRIGALTGRPLREILSLLLELIFLLSFRVAAGLATIGFLDLLYRRWKNNKDMMMSKEDAKEERKRTEGDPKIKGRIRELERSLALQRMRTDLKSADVVVRNPTHFAVALRYDRAQDPSPKVVAKGRGLMALTIIRLAEEYGIEVVENRPLARELYRVVRIGDLIPEKLFRAVAELLAYVYRKKKKFKIRRETTGVE